MFVEILAELDYSSWEMVYLVLQRISKVTLYFKFSATWPSSRNNFV